MSSKFCINCGEQLKSLEQKFCSMCGAPTSTESLGGGVDLLKYDFKGNKFEEFSEDAFTFRNANVLLVSATSENWFQGVTTPAEKIAKEFSGALPEWAEKYELNPYFLDGLDFFEQYEPVLWESSSFGKRFIKALESRGAHIGHGYLGRQIEIQNPDGKSELVPISRPIDLMSGRWGLSDGTEFVQKGLVFKSKKDGREIVYWHIDALVNSRPSINSHSESISHRVLIPHMLQVATYLAETAFPSALAGSMSLVSRESLYGENLSNIPRPVTRFLIDDYCLGLSKTAMGSQAIAYWAPEVFQHGYVFEQSMTDEEIFASLPVVCDGLPKIAEIIVDGYSNWPEGSDLDFQLSLLSDITKCEDDDFYRHGAFIPGIIYGKLVERGIEFYNDKYRQLGLGIQENNDDLIDQALNGLNSIAMIGPGSIFLHAVNSFTATILELEIDVPIDDMLEWCSYIDVDSQGLNSLSNLLVSKIAAKSFREADQLLVRALNMAKRPGPNLETVSHFQPWDGSEEVSIVVEIYESALEIKSQLGKTSEMKEIALDIVAYCEKKELQNSLLETARQILS